MDTNTVTETAQGVQEMKTIRITQGVQEMKTARIAQAARQM